MPKSRSNIPEHILFIWAFLIGISILLLPASFTGRLQFVFGSIFRIHLSPSKTLAASSYTAQLPPNAVSVTRYNQLQNHLANVVEWLNTERQKVEKLSGMKDRPVWKGVNFVPADILITSSPAKGELIINRGSDDGLIPGQCVQADCSIIGKIGQVTSRTASVILLTNEQAKTSVMTASLDANIIMQGCAENTAKILYLPTKYKVKLGDAVFIRKQPGFLDTPMIVGRITKCSYNQDSPLLWDITVTPACNITDLKEVEVIIMNPQQ